MKTQISRNNFRREKRYSGVYQQQGRMVVDADVNEQTDISKTRLDHALRDVINSGIPESGGLDIVTDSEGGIRIIPGRLYVEGIPAEVGAAEGVTVIPYDQQEDFPGAPPILLETQSPPESPPGPEDAYTVYVDVWERTVLALEDPELLDSGLHGADTCTRTRTMAQIKWCPANRNPEETTYNPPCGDAKLTLELREVTNAEDRCDPCAEEVQLDLGTGNYLFRVEVHDVGRDDAGNATLTLKWSSENGAEQYSVDNVPLDFTSGQWVYEFYNERAETHLGWHLVEAPGFPTRGILTADYAAAPSPTSYPYVRRWDGYCTLVREGNEWKLQSDASGSLGVDRGVTLNPTSDPVSGLADINIGDEVTINLSGLRLTLTLREGGFDNVFVPGDYWQALVREQDMATSPPELLLEGEEPHGIVHHYMLLAEVEGNTVTVPNDLGCNRYAFPPLTHLMASRICFDNTCPELYGADASNLQEALTNLCSQLDASDVAYDEPVCPGSSPTPTLRALLQAKLGGGWPDVDGDGAATVKDILDALLCHLDAARLPYDAGPSQARWNEVTENGTSPQTTQEAIDTLIRELDSTDIPLDKSDPNLCPTLQPTNVRTVHDALNALCRGGAGGCAHTVGAGGVFATLDDAIEALQENDVISVCLLPGEHVLSTPIENESLRTIRIAGSGSAASRVRLMSDYVLPAAEVILRDLLIAASSGRSLRIVVSKVDVQGCRFERTSLAADGRVPFVQLESPGTALLQWQDTAVVAIHIESRASDAEEIYLPSRRVLDSTHRVRSDLRSLLALDPGLEPVAYQRALDTAAKDVAALSTAIKQRWKSEEPTDLINGLSNERLSYVASKFASTTGAARPIEPSAALRLEVAEMGPRDAARNFYAVIDAPGTTVADIRAALDNVVRANTSTSFDIGLGLNNHQVGGFIHHSAFDAELLLNAGIENGLLLRREHLPPEGLKDPVIPGGHLRLAGNYLHRILALVPKDAIDDNGQLAQAVPGYQSVFVNENVFTHIDSGLIGMTMNMQGNHFEVSDVEATVALFVGRFGAFTGNWAAVRTEIATTIADPADRSSNGNLQLDVH